MDNNSNNNDNISLRDGDSDVDLEKGIRIIKDEDQSKDSISIVKMQAKEFLGKIYGVFVDDGDEEQLNLCQNAPNSNGVSVEQAKLEGSERGVDNAEKQQVVKEKRKKMSNKKPPKPPRPPRGPSLDAADQKLIKELTELAMLKRAKVERMKALKKMKAAKVTSSSNSNMIAMVFTVLFFLVIIFQGMSSRVASGNVPGSPVSAETVDNGLIAVQFFGNPSTSDPNEPRSESPNSVKPISGHDPPEI